MRGSLSNFKCCPHDWTMSAGHHPSRFSLHWTAFNEKGQKNYPEFPGLSNNKMNLHVKEKLCTVHLFVSGLDAIRTLVFMSCVM